MTNFIQIDEITVLDHSYLKFPEDDCYYLGNYTSKAANANTHTAGNSIIHNLKKKPTTSSSPGYHYKQDTIRQLGNIIGSKFGAQTIENSTFIPIPPSKAKGHPDYDDRMLQILQSSFRRGAAM
jgi:hypothetical protein